MGVPFRGKEEVPGTHQAYTTIAFLIRITTISRPTQSLSTLFNSLWATLAYPDPRSRLPGAFLCNGGAFAPTQLPTLPLTQTSEASAENHPNPQTHTIALYALQFPLGYPCLPVPSFASPRGLPVQRRGIRFHTSDPPESQRSLRCFSEGPIYPYPHSLYTPERWSGEVVQAG